MNARADVNHNEADDGPEFGRRFQLRSSEERFDDEDAKMFFADCQRAAMRQRLRAWLFCSTALEDFHPKANNEWIWELAEMLFEDGAAEMQAMKDAAATLEAACAARNRAANNGLSPEAVDGKLARYRETVRAKLRLQGWPDQKIDLFCNLVDDEAAAS